MTQQFPAMAVPALRAIRSMAPLHAALCVSPLYVWLRRDRTCELARTMPPCVAETNVATATFDAQSIDFSCGIA